MLARARYIVGLAALVTGCGGDTNTFTNAQPNEAGLGGSSAGGQSGAGGAGQSGAGGGSGQGGNGGSGVSGADGGGQAGAGGALDAGNGDGGGPGPCAAPGNPNDTAVCMRFPPENIRAEADPSLDKRGVFVVQIFDTPNPPKQNASQAALFERVLPADSATGGEIAIADIKQIRAVAAFPQVVYIRAVFADNAAALANQNLAYGVWIGGVNFLDGIQKDEPLLPTTLHRGQGNLVEIPLTALRKLDVTVHLAAKPVGDGQGPLAVVVVNDADVSKKPAPVGLATKACADVTKGDVHLTGFFVGGGQHWVTGVLKDLGGTGDLPEGALAALNVTSQSIRIPASFTASATDYTAAVTINLNYVVPWSPDAGPVPPNSCADLGIGGDAGP